MKKLISTCAIAAIIAISAHAHAATDWSGFYAGLNAGAMLGESSANTHAANIGNYFANSSVTSIIANGTQKLNPLGVVGGAQGGYNYQTGHWVLGLEGNASGSTASDSKSTTVVYPCCSPSTYTISQKVSNDWAVSLSPKIGYAFDSTPIGDILGYISAGVVASQINYESTFSDNYGLNAFESQNVSEFHAGWSVGTGAEVALNSHWSVRPEYMYTNYGKVRPTGTLNANGGSTAPMEHSADLTSSIFRVGVNYRFH
ncbi:MAG: outer membrane beta-barrel protein [Bdellovibrionales bacterium]